MSIRRTSVATCLASAALIALPAFADAGSAGDWWQRLQSLCGHAYAGELIRAPAGDDAFRNRRVVMHVRDCTEDRVRVPLAVDDDHSRTWVFTRNADGIELRHDHRHRDGTPDAVTLYGGRTSNSGSADTQVFPADDQTRDAIPGSGLRSVWLVEIHPGERFVYAANRVGTERGFQVDFDLSQTVDAPEAPWGWED
ncbi:hypothetical protein E2F46_08750 [Luteimonas aestuarii]|uniref:Secreted protein n=1 Tax=Luteimonas aestuarii TaxID=453837 RepID=A0A4R5TTM5_9GAMM|nr:hypothetical protein [Luteimonas aestuarii]TDK24362.1 hypothetical protein E2F46_08750 [Luteimonas aestuarii]